MEQRVRDAALQIYADVGWPGFSLDVVARRAGILKSTVYVRWSSKEALLYDALQSTSLNLTHSLDTGSFRGDLLQLARQWLDGFLSPAGRVSFRIYAESPAQPEIFTRCQQEIYAQRIKAGRAIVRRARERGEIPPETSTTIVLDIMVGSMMNHVMSTPTELMKDMRAKSPQFIEQLVDFVLLGVKAQEAARKAQPPPKPPAPPAPRKKTARKAPKQAPRAPRGGRKPAR